MRLLTHNMLMSNIKGVKNGYPLLIEAVDVVVNEVEFNPEFISRMIPRLDWSAVFQAAKQLGKEENLPLELAPEFENDEKFLRKAHHVLLEVEVQKGFLVCPETSRKFPVENGIPNMLLNEDEI
ncbi:multifunctional methyltransferase subunit TRM112-like protein [Xenia sp. Carnegie-2017]|uniref:multifunctional methyltransferase subunit TRM112-like protein n=1 Tax=Xenia sp. Carnegie-2017 TaxID=2897299 RepID=UPI001F0458E8|nr:multifunctional methyltransferase subunit TRM112-like protein [Xenia sp. Carnegie-2017]